jgi:hypothetical protein
VGGGGGIAVIFQPGGLNRTIHPVSIADNMTIKRSTTGFGLKRPGDGVAASLYEGILVDFFGGGVNTQSDTVACMQLHTLRLHTLMGGNMAMLPVRGIAHAHLPTAATGLDDARHCWAWK